MLRTKRLHFDWSADFWRFATRYLFWPPIAWELFRRLPASGLRWRIAGSALVLAYAAVAAYFALWYLAAFFVIWALLPWHVLYVISPYLLLVLSGAWFGLAISFAFSGKWPVALLLVAPSLMALMSAVLFVQIRFIHWKETTNE